MSSSKVLVIGWALVLATTGLLGCCLSPIGESTGGASGAAAAGGSEGTSGTAGSTNGGSPGGSTAGGSPSCSWDAGVQEDDLHACAHDGDCGCPLACVVDPELGTGLCERPCGTTADCPSLYTSCASGHCAPVLCGSQFGAPLDAVCSYDDAGALGTCLPPDPSTAIGSTGGAVGVCSEGGGLSFTEQCDPGLARSSGIYNVCRAGAVCASSFGSICLQACDPNGPETCGPQVCTPVDAQDPLLGICLWGRDGGRGCSSAGAACLWFGTCCSGNCKAGQCE
jgi:hypothetical protein